MNEAHKQNRAAASLRRRVNKLKRLQTELDHYLSLNPPPGDENKKADWLEWRDKHCQWIKNAIADVRDALQRKGAL